jgi:hypothetical protein
VPPSRSRIDPPRPVITGQGRVLTSEPPPSRSQPSGSCCALVAERLSVVPLDRAAPYERDSRSTRPPTSDEGDTSEAGRGDWRYPSSTAKPRPDERSTRVLARARPVDSRWSAACSTSRSQRSRPNWSWRERADAVHRWFDRERPTMRNRWPDGRARHAGLDDRSPAPAASTGRRPAKLPRSRRPAASQACGQRWMRR